MPYKATYSSIHIEPLNSKCEKHYAPLTALEYTVYKRLYLIIFTLAASKFKLFLFCFIYFISVKTTSEVNFNIINNKKVLYFEKIHRFCIVFKKDVIFIYRIFY